MNCILSFHFVGSSKLPISNEMKLQYAIHYLYLYLFVNIHLMMIEIYRHFKK
jgi:hypothetical protein